MLAHHQGVTPLRRRLMEITEPQRSQFKRWKGWKVGSVFFPISVKPVQSLVQSSYRNFNNIFLYKRNVVCEVHGMPTYNISTLTIY